MFRTIFAQTVWAKGALDHEPKKFRSLWRVWLPLYDGLAFTAGLLAIFLGSRLLDRVFGTDLVDLLGAVFALVAFVCFLGVAFPALWKIETVGKILLVGMVLAYVFCIIFLRTPTIAPEPPNLFVAAMLLVGIPLPLFRLNQLAEEEFDRRVQRRVKELQS